MNKVFFRRKKITENQENSKGPKKSNIRFFSKRIFSGIFLLSLLYIAFASVRFITGIHNQSIHKAINNSAVLGTTTTNAVNELGNVAFNIPAFFNAPAEFKKSLTVDGSVLFNNNVKLNNKDLDLGTGIVTAANLNNLINGLTAGTGITVSTGNSPTITNTGVLSVQGQTGAVTFTAGSGLSLTGTAISNIGVTSFQGSTGSITLTPGTNISISGTTITDTLASNLTNNGIVYANSGSTITSLTPAAAGYILQSNGTGTAPSWSTSLALGGSLSNSTLAGANAVLYGAPTTGLFSIVTTTTGSQCLLSASGPSGAPSWGTCALGTNFWQLVSGVLSPATISNDLAIGGTATSSALFQVFATTGNATSSGNFTFNSAASLQTTENQSLTFGGATTGNIILDPLNGIGNVGIDTTGPKATFDVVGSTNNGSVDSFRVESNNRNGYLYANYVATATTPYVTMGGWNLLTSSFAPIQTPKGFYIGLNTTPPASPGLLNVEGNASGNAAAVINQYGVGDIFTASQSGKTEFVITHSGYVGIGPSYVADDNNGAGGSSGISQLSVTDTTPGKYLKLILNGPATNGGTAIEFMTNGSTAADLVYDKTAGALQLNNREPNQPIVFQTFNSGEQERMRIDQNGMVGIGNTLMGNTSLVVNQPNSSGDIFSASASGSTQFTVQHNGHVIIRNGADSGYPDSLNGLVTIDGQGGAGGIPSLVLENSPQDIGFPSGDNLQIGQWDGTTWNERLRINDGGNVGVGTTTPGSKLEVNGNITAKIPNGQGQVIAYGPNGSTYMYMQVDSGNSNGYIAMNGFTSPLGFSGGGNTVFEPNQGVFKVDGNTYTNSLSLQQNDVTGKVNNTFGVLTLQSDQTIVVNKNGPNTFDIFSASSSGSPKFVINNAGNVGVGTTNPIAPLQVGSDSYITPDLLLGGGTNVANYLSLSGGRSMFGYDANGNGFVGISGGNNKGIEFFVNGTSGSFLSGNQAMTILPNGNVGVGTTTPNNSIQVANLINFDGSNNGTYLGYHAGNAITNSNSSENTLVGVDAGYQTTTGYDNAALGMESLYANTTGFENVALGAYSLYGNTTGSDNVSVGYKALYVNTTGQNNVALGVTALEHNTIGIQNVALGSGALQANTTGDDNYGLGSYALYTNTTGSRNVAVGSLALNSNLSGSDSAAFGHEALRENTTGHDNTGLGNYALYSNTTGFYNTSVGDSSLEDNLIGINNASLGFQSLYYNTASNSSALGANALIDNTTGTDNVAMGYNAGYTNNSGNANTTGSFNTFIGDNAGPGISTQLTNATAIGANATVNQSNSLILGSINGINGSTTSTGVGIGVQSPIGGLDVEGAFAGQALMTLNYTGTNQNIFTASKSGATKFVIDHNGNVGIGTTSPTQKLDISGGNAVFDSGYGIYSRGGGGTSGYLILTGDETGTILRSGDNDAADGISFQSFDGTTRMFIGSGSSYAGNVGIGTITPSAKLELAGTTGLGQATGTTPSLLAADDGNNTNIFQVTATGGIEQMGTFNSPFGGIGFYENLLAYSQGNFSGGSYTAYWTKPTTTDNTTDVQAPDGSYTATKAVLPSSLPNGSEGYIQFTTPSPVTGQPWTDSIWLRGAASGEQVQIGSDDENLSSTFTLTKTWKRYNYSTGNRVSSTQNRGFEIQFLTPSSTAYLWGAQAERRSFPGVYVATTANAVVPSPAGYNSGFIVNATGSALFNGNIQMNNSTAQIIGPSGTYGINFNSGGIGSNLYALQLSRSSGTSYTQPDIIGSSNGLVIGGLSGSTGTIALNTSGSSIPTMYLTGGNVGIGTTSPTSQLSIYNPNAGYSTLSLSSSNGAGTEMLFGDALSYSGAISFDDTQGQWMEFRTNGTTSGSNRLIIDGGGNIGIGTKTNNPLATLDLRATQYTTPVASISGATGKATLVLDQSGGINGGDIFAASASGLNRFVIQQNGNVGIGTTTPGALLDVNNNSDSMPTIRASDYGTATTPPSNEAAVYGYNYWNNGYAGVFKSANAGTGLYVSADGTGYGLLVNQGNVGIGTTTPSSLFSVGTLFGNYSAFTVDTSGNTIVGPYNTLNNSNPAQLIMGNYQNSGNPYPAWLVNSTGAYWMGIGQADTSYTSGIRIGPVGNTHSQWPTIGTDIARIILDGSVGIDTTSPLTSTGLDIEKNSLGNSALVVNNSGGQGDILTASSAGVAKFVINSAGNVGVGTTTPGSLLDIVPSNSSYSDELRVYSPDKSEYMGFTWDTAHVGLFSSGQSIDLFNSIYNAGGTFDNGNYGMNDISQLGVGTTETALATADIRSTNGTIPVASISGETSFASLVVDQSGVGDLFTASTAGLTRFRIDNTGNTSIFGASLCVKSNNTPCAGTTPGSIYASNQTVQAGDVAENYISAQALAPGDIVMPAGDGNNTAVVKTTSSYQSQAIGIVSTDPGVTLNSAAETDSTHPNKYPIALAGRVPVKVTTANGVIHTGDLLTTSAQPGVAQKATQAGVIIGKALEDYTNTDTTVIGKIMIYVNISWGDPTIQFTADGNLDIISSNSTASANGPVASVPVSQLSSTDINSQVAGLSNTVASMQNQIASITAQMTKVQNISDITTQINALEKQVNALNILNATSSNNILATTDATISGSLSVTGETLLSQVGITGNLSMGLLQISGGTDTNNQPAINTLSGPLQLQSDGLNGLDILNGKITIAATGDIRAIGSITAKKYNVDTTDNSSASVGEGTIPSGTTYVVIKTTAVTGTSKIFVTPHIPAVLGVTAQSKGNSFTVTIDNPQSQAIQFDWWVIN